MTETRSIGRPTAVVTFLALVPAICVSIAETQAAPGAQAGDQITRDLGNVEKLTKTRRYEQAAAEYARLIPGIADPKLKKQAQRQERVNALYAIAKESIIRLVGNEHRIRVPKLGYVRHADEQCIHLEVEGLAMSLDWHKVSDKEFLNMTGRAAEKSRAAELYLAYAMLLLNEGRAPDARQWLQRALSISSDVTSEYPDVFAASQERMARKRQEMEKRREEEAERRKERQTRRPSAPPADPEQLQQEITGLIAAAAGSPKGGSREVQSLVNKTGPDGYAHIPAGCYEIMETIQIRDGMRIAGAGMNKTVLFRDPAKFKDNRKPIFQVRGQQGRGGTQICGIAFVGDTDEDDAGWDTAISLSSCVDFRVDHCYFRRFGAAAVAVHGESQGLVDHCAWTDIFKPGINNVGYGVVVHRGNNWEDGKELGTAQATFVEDCILTGCRHAIASNGGAHYVFRHNVVRKNVVASSVDAHGLGYGSKRGTRCVEIYGNVIEDPVAKGTAIGIRGGDGVIFGNTIKGFANPILLTLEWGTPQELKSAYPAKDQIRDLWIWDNKTVGGSPQPVINRNAKGFIEKDRDYHTKPKPGYVPYVYPHPLAQGGPFDEKPRR